MKYNPGIRISRRSKAMQEPCLQDVAGEVRAKGQRKPRGESPTSRTLRWLRDAGMTPAVVERRLPKRFTTIDLYGCIDVVAMDRRQTGLLGVQATSGTNHAARATKILGLPEAKLWLECGNRLWVVSWVKYKKPKNGRFWQPRVENITIGMFPEDLT